MADFLRKNIMQDSFAYYVNSTDYYYKLENAILHGPIQRKRKMAEKF